MAVLNASPLLLREVAAGGDDYQIERSLKFNKADSAHLTRTPGTKGNQRTWTYATWFKRIDPGTKQEFFGISNAGSGYAMSVELASDQLYVYIGEDAATYYVSSTKYRDPSAWYHLVIAYDSNQPRVKDRIRVYINGETVANPTTNAAPTLGHKGAWNRVATHYLNATSAAQNQSDSQLADTYFIDGMQLHASAFGTRDSSGAWKPKEFAIPQINDGTVWSTPSYWSGTEKSDAPYDYGFDGNTGSATSGTTATIAKIDNSATSGFVNYNFTPPNPITFVDTVEVCGGISSVRYSINNEPFVWGASTGDWQTIASGGGTINTINIEADNHYPEFRGFRVDGVVLLDNTNDVTGRNNPNDGTEWSSGTEAGTPLGSNDDADNAFDGLTDDSYSMLPATGSTYSVTLPHSVTVKERVRLHCHTGSASAYAKVYITPTGGSNTAYSTSGPADVEGGWKELFTGTGELTKVEVVADGSSRAGIQAVEVDGHILVDNVGDNSFHLKYNATGSITRYIGKDTLNGKIDDATGGLPIYKTTDDYGDVKGSGHRADSNASSLVLAVPGDTVADVSHSSDLRNSGSALSLTNNGTVAATTDHSRFYGSALSFNGSDQWLDIPSISTNNNNKFCIEFWVKHKQDAEQQIIEFKSSDSSGDYIYIQQNTNEGYRFRGGGLDKSTTSSFARDGDWVHVAYTNDGSKARAFVNGTLVGEGDSSSWSIQSTLIGAIGAGADSGHSQKFNGYIQDVRVYFGIAKYTASFTAPNRNDWTVHNLTPAGGSSGISSGGNWSGGTAFRKHSRTTWSNASAWDLSSGDSFNTNGNNKVLYIDRESLGGVYNITIEDTGGTNDIYVAEADDGSSWSETYNNQNKIILTESSSTYISTSGTTSDVTSSIKRYLRLEGAGGGDCTMTVSGTAFGTSAAETDVLVDSPTNYGTDEGAGGEVRGNYCTWNPFDRIDTTNVLLTEGNLKIQTPGHTTSATAYGTTRGTIGVTSGKYYWEIDGYTQYGSTGTMLTGVIETEGGLPTTVGDGGNSISYSASDGKKRIDNGTGVTYGDTYTTGDVIGVALDMDNGAIYFSKNNTWQNSGSPTSGSSRTNAAATWTAGTKSYTPGISDFQEGSGRYITASLNAGQRAWKYTAPSGFQALCTQNLPDTFSGDEVNNPSKYFNVTTYKGIDTDQTIVIPGLSPEFVWIKEFSAAQQHQLYDVIRGSANNYKRLEIQGTDDSDTLNSTGEETKTDGVQTFNSNGFDIGGNPALCESPQSYVAWCWDAGSSAATPKSGATGQTITATASWVNADAGFEVLTYQGANLGNTAKKVGHNLAAKPEFIIFKNRNTSNAWCCYHKEVGNGDHIRLNTLAQTNTATILNNTDPTNELITLSDDSNVWDDSTGGNEHIAYIWTGISGYSKFGSYEGNSSADGTFVYTGFRPRYLWIKRSTGNGDWQFLDAARDPDNPVKALLSHDTPAQNDNTEIVDFLSNGFKLRASSDYRNTTGETYLYASWAEHPMKTSRAR